MCQALRALLGQQVPASNPHQATAQPTEPHGLRDFQPPVADVGGMGGTSVLVVCQDEGEHLLSHLGGLSSAPIRVLVGSKHYSHQAPLRLGASLDSFLFEGMLTCNKVATLDLLLVCIFNVSSDPSTSKPSFNYKS